MGTLKHPVCTVDWVARLCCSWLSLGKATRISRGEIPVRNTVIKVFFFFLSNHASLFERSGLNSSRKKRTLVLVVYFLLRQKTLLNTRQGQKCHFVRDRAPVFDNRRKFSGFKFNRTRILTRNASFSFSSMVDAAQTSSKVSGMLPCKGYNLSHF